MLELKQLFLIMHEREASDLFLRINSPPRMRIFSEVIPIGEDIITAENMNKYVAELLDDEKKQRFRETKDVDFAVYAKDLGRFRFSIFIQRGSPSVVARRIRKDILTFEGLNLPADISTKLAEERRGMVLLTGAAGSGKSTTIASMIEYINKHRKAHILTVEEPIEYTFDDKMSLINQREIGLDVTSYHMALRQFTLQSPDVIFIGTIRDQETMHAALTAAETGVLVFSTLHTINAYQTVQRIINFFPPYQHKQILMQLSILLKGVISLRLIKRVDTKGMIPSYEVMTLSPSISRLLREGNLWEIPRYMEDAEIYGMTTFKKTFLKLVREGKITPHDAVDFADKKEEMLMELKNIPGIEL